ncbi:FecCD family ABC transporter permease [Arhodomonas sp. AD133]|uniref:FecCD family ABC transporter permease n=1 Tax=Arhodomonas sp. AD133 TaxID=3415009 RepID=UPI003EBA5EBD
MSSQMRHRNRGVLVLAGLGIALAVTVVLSLAVGAAAVPMAAVVGALLDTVGLNPTSPVDRQFAAIVVDIRLPRVLLGMLVGGGLACAGAMMQGIFRNPLADPGLIGVSNGAAVAAVAVIVLPLGWFGGVLGEFALPLAAFAGGLVATVLVYRLGRLRGSSDVATLLLAGIAVNAIAGAGTGILVYSADNERLRDLTFWLMGSLSGATWGWVAAVTVPMGVAMVAMPSLARALNAFLVGEAVAGHLGYPVDRIKQAGIALAALAVGAAVAATGVIGFVGLVVPHLIRLAFGADHRLLLPASGLLGATLLLLADLLARTVVAPAELPIGIVTALLGGPFFLYLLRRSAYGRIHG